MGKYIVKLPCDGQDYFLEWSSVVDAPITRAMTWKEFKKHYRYEYGAFGMTELPERMERVDESGTSDAIDRRPVLQWVSCNRAGDYEQRLTFDEIIDKYVRKPT